MTAIQKPITTPNKTTGTGGQKKIRSIGDIPPAGKCNGPNAGGTNPDDIAAGINSRRR